VDHISAVSKLPAIAQFHWWYVALGLTLWLLALGLYLRRRFSPTGKLALKVRHKADMLVKEQVILDTVAAELRKAIGVTVEFAEQASAAADAAAAAPDRATAEAAAHEAAKAAARARDAARGALATKRAFDVAQDGYDRAARAVEIARGEAIKTRKRNRDGQRGEKAKPAQSVGTEADAIAEAAQASADRAARAVQAWDVKAD